MTDTTTLLQALPLVQKLGVTAGQTIGDFGAGGSGHIAVELGRAVGAEGRVLLFDVQKSALSAAMSSLQTHGVNNVQTVWTDLEVYRGASGIGDATLEAGILVNVLHQSKQPKAILAEVARMVKPGARLLVVDWLTEAATPLAPPPAMRLGAEHVGQIAQAVGFAQLEIFSAGPYYWGLVLIKT